MSKFAAETAVNVGDFSAAKALIEPLLLSAPDNPQTLGIAAHLYGQQHDVAKRDATLARLQALHDAGTIKLDSLPVEKDTLPGGKSVTIFYFLTPFSRFNIVLMARFYDAEGKQTHRIALESDDIDQVQFAKQHPTEAAAGVRIYSMDSYTDHVDASGRLTGQTHGTLCPAPGCFLTGRPTYEFFREHTYGTAASPETPISSTNSIVPSSAPK